MKEYQIVREDWEEFLKELNEYEKQNIVKEKENLLLDSYLDWLRTKEERYKLRVLNIALDLENLGVFINLDKLFPKE